MIEPARRCFRCLQERPIRDFHKDKTRASGFRDICKGCCKEYYRATRAEHIARSERARERMRATPEGRETLRKWGAWPRNGRKYPPRAANAANVAKSMLYKAKGRANKRGMAFDLTIDDIEIPTVCPVLGVPITINRGAQSDTSPSLDRVNNLLGYVRGNVRVVSFRANRIKSAASSEELAAIARFYGPGCGGLVSGMLGFCGG